MPLSGFIRFRKHQVGVTSSITSNVAASRILPYRGPIVINPNRTTPDVDTGTLDPVLAPFYGAAEYTGSWNGVTAFDDLPYVYALGIKGGVTPTVAAGAYTWTYAAASTTPDPFDYVTDQWGDDATTDVITGGAGVINDFELSFGEDLGAFSLSANLLYARGAFGAGFTGGLSIDASPEWVYGAHTVVYMDTVAGAIGTSPIVDAIHGVTFSVNNNLDQKRFANGSNSAWNLAGFGRGPREITLTLVLAKTTATIAEAATLDDVPVPTLYFDIKTTSTELIGATPRSNSLRFAATLESREDGELENNSTITLVYKGKYDATLAYALRASVVNTLAAL